MGVNKDWALESRPLCHRGFETLSWLMNQLSQKLTLLGEDTWMILYFISNNNFHIISYFILPDQLYTKSLRYYAAICSEIWSCFFGQVPGNEIPSTLISFSTKTLNAGQIISKLHVIELGAQPGLHIFTSFTSFSHVLIQQAI